MNATYRLTEPATVFSPSLVFYPELIRRNIARVKTVLREKQTAGAGGNP